MRGGSAGGSGDSSVGGVGEDVGSMRLDLCKSDHDRLGSRGEGVGCGDPGGTLEIGIKHSRISHRK